jgi:hypothetical protein
VGFTLKQALVTACVRSLSQSTLRVNLFCQEFAGANFLKRRAAGKRLCWRDFLTFLFRFSPQPEQFRLRRRNGLSRENDFPKERSI